LFHAYLAFGCPKLFSLSGIDGDETDHSAKKRDPFDEGRGNQHGCLNLIRGLGLTRDPHHGGHPNHTDPKGCAKGDKPRAQSGDTSVHDLWHVLSFRFKMTYSDINTVEARAL
jgi:hypothetical protein